MAKVEDIDQKRAERDRQKQDRLPALKPDRWIGDGKGNMEPAPPGPSIFDV